MHALDELDLEIIKILKKDSRTAFTKIASMLGVSDATIHVRLKKLKDEGVLLRYTVEINEELLGKKVLGIAMINVKHEHLEKVAQQLISNNRIKKLYETHDESDLVALFEVGSIDELHETIKDIKKIENVSLIASSNILKIWK
jgi:Lrp/AsnC family transcriptional regulator for asnA, asnC and gidA